MIVMFPAFPAFLSLGESVGRNWSMIVETQCGFNEVRIYRTQAGRRWGMTLTTDRQVSLC
jgi:hypothetical protein